MICRSAIEGEDTVRSRGRRSIRSHMRRATLGQSVAECAVGLGMLWHPEQTSATFFAPGDSGSGKLAAVIPAGGSATNAAAKIRMSLTPPTAESLGCWAV